MKKILVIAGLIIGLLTLIALGAYLYVGKKALNSPQSATEDSAENPAANIASQTGSKCEKQYQSLLSQFGQNFDDCRIEIAKAEDCTKDPNDPNSGKKTNVVIIFDSSGSMAGRLTEGAKIDIAKEAAANFIKELDPQTNLSIVLYGHKGGNSAAQKAASCAGIEEVYYMGPLNAAVASSKIASAVPTGWTPIAASLAKAGQILEKYPKEQNKNVILLISDGEETCDGNPVAKAKELLSSGQEVITNVVGFDVAGAQEKELQDVASSGGGKYYSVKNKEDFSKALKENSNFMRGFECYMEQSDVWVGNQNNVTFKKNECINRLDLSEKNEIQLSANLGNNGATKDCQNHILSQYQKRYDDILRQINEGYSQGQADAAAEEAKLKDIEKTTDEGEGVFQNN